MFSVCLVDERVGKEKKKKLCVFSLLLFVTWRAKRSTSWSFASIIWFSRVKLFYFPTKTTNNSRDLRLTFYNFLFLYSFFSEPNRAIGLAWVSGAFYFYFKIFKFDSVIFIVIVFRLLGPFLHLKFFFNIIISFFLVVSFSAWEFDSDLPESFNHRNSNLTFWPWFQFLWIIFLFI